MMIICTILNIIILCLKRTQAEHSGLSTQEQNVYNGNNPNIGPDGRNKNILNGKNLLFTLAITTFLVIQFVAHVLRLNVSIRLEVSFLMLTITPSFLLSFTFLNKYGIKGFDPLKEAFNI